MSPRFSQNNEKCRWHRLSSLCRDTRGRVSYTSFKELFVTVTGLKPARGRGMERLGRVAEPRFRPSLKNKTSARYTLGANTGIPIMGWYYCSAGMAVSDIYC